MLNLIKYKKKKEINKQIYKYILMQFAYKTLYSSLIQKYFIFIYNWENFHKFDKKSKHICFLTGRRSAVYRTFHLSRLKIKEHAQFGHFLGLKKISW